MGRIPSLSALCVIGLLMVGAFWMGQHQARGDQQVDATIPTPFVETLAQVRCSIYVAEDGSATWEDGDAARDECWLRVTGHHLFRHWQHLRD
jgi:hypothetical protein